MDKTNSRDVHLKMIWTYLRTYPDKFLRFSLILTLNFLRIFFFNFFTTFNFLSTILIILTILVICKDNFGDL